MELSDIQFTSKNILNWLYFTTKFYPYTRKELFQLKRFLKRNDKFTRDRLVEDIFQDNPMREEKKGGSCGRYRNV